MFFCFMRSRSGNGDGSRWEFVDQGMLLCGRDGGSAVAPRVQNGDRAALKGRGGTGDSSGCAISPCRSYTRQTSTSLGKPMLVTKNAEQDHGESGRRSVPLPERGPEEPTRMRSTWPVMTQSVWGRFPIPGLQLPRLTSSNTSLGCHRRPTVATCHRSSE